MCYTFATVFIAAAQACYNTSMGMSLVPVLVTSR